MSGSAIINEVRRSFYLDSVALMRLSRALADLNGVEEAVMMIGTEANKRIMRDAALLDVPGSEAGPEDLVIAVRACDEDSAWAAAEKARELLESTKPADGAAGAWRPRTWESALGTLEDANLAVVSVPGEFAAREARKALSHGLNVMIFSDNVPLKAEISLKREAAGRGLLVMGPDCGTAIVAGVPIAFANEVPHGRIGIVSASGTGLQEVSVLLARNGAGVSHGIGVGGRDLDDAVGAVSTLAAIDALAADSGTDCIVLISKPPGDNAARLVLSKLANVGKPAVACLIGARSVEARGGLVLADTLKSAVEAALGRPIDDDRFDSDAIADAQSTAIGARRRHVHGWYSGGTLCAEVQVVFQAAGASAWSNAPLSPAFARGDAESPGHRVIDLGADEYTVGRPHPMIAPEVRRDAIARSLVDPTVGVVLLDVMLGYGAHPDPSQALVDVLGAAPTERPAVVASVCGTDRDPQRRSAQVAKLQAAGAIVAPCNADAASLALAIVNR